MKKAPELGSLKIISRTPILTAIQVTQDIRAGVCLHGFETVLSQQKDSEGKLHIREKIERIGASIYEGKDCNSFCNGLYGDDTRALLHVAIACVPPLLSALENYMGGNLETWRYAIDILLDTKNQPFFYGFTRDEDWERTEPFYFKNSLKQPHPYAAGWMLMKTVQPVVAGYAVISFY